MGDYKKLKVWRKAHAMSLNVNRILGRIRNSQHTSLRTQAIRSARSVSTNIVEGSGQTSDREFARFLGYSSNSARETEYHVLSAHDLRLISTSDFQSLTDQLVEVQKMLYGLIESLSPDADGE